MVCGEWCEGNGEWYLGRHNLTNVLITEFLQNRSLAGVIQAQHQQASLLVGLYIWKGGENREKVEYGSYASYTQYRKIGY